MSPKLGLVGAVAVCWLLTFMVMGGDVLPALTSSSATASTGSPIVPQAAAPGPAQLAIPVSSDATPPPESTAATPATDDTTALAGPVLVGRPGPRRFNPPVAEFRMASFNILGSRHTAPGGHSPRMASGVTRTHWAVTYIKQHDLDLIGFQELQPDQRRTFMNDTGGKYGLYPYNRLKQGEGSNSIAWRLDTWELVKADTITIPYFGGRPTRMPVLLLKHKESGLKVYIANFHNPAFPENGHWRNVAASRQATLARRLTSTGIPMMFTGDMNMRQSWFCKVAPAGDLRAAAGGTSIDGCKPPGGRFIDWIVGSHDIEFIDYVRDRGGAVRRITDHPVMRTDVRIDGDDFPKAITAD